MALIKTIKFGSLSIECYCRIDGWHATVNEGDGLDVRVSIEVYPTEKDRRALEGKLKNISETVNVEGGDGRDRLYEALKKTETFEGAKDV